MGIGVEVLGPVRVTYDGAPLDLGPRRHAEVVAALAVDAGHLVPAEQVMQRVWGEDASPSPTTLHALVSRLRGRLREAGADGLLITDPPGYRLDPAVGPVDAAVFTEHLLSARRLVAEGDPAGARDRAAAGLALWRGRPYLTVRAEWASAEADRLQELWLAGQELLAETRVGLGEHEAVLDALPALVAAHPLREALRGTLMLAQYRAGRQVAALATYDEGRALLADELGVDPGPDLQRLWTRILRQDPSLLAAATAALVVTPTPVPRRVGLVGRGPELDRLDRVVRDAAAGRRTGVALVRGEAGIGKSALVDAVAARDGVLVVRGGCAEHGGAPALWPWEQALGRLVGALGSTPWLDPEQRTQLAALVPGLAERAAATPGRLAEAVTALLRGAGELGPVLVLLEDLQWADTETVALLEHLLRELRADRLAFVVTARDGEPGAGELVSGLTRAVTRAGGEVLALTGLDVAEVGALAGVPPEEAAALHARTDGHPLYVVELTRLPASGGPVPDGVRAVVEGRLRGVADRALLEVAAVIGRELDPALLARVTGRQLPEVAEALDGVAALGLLTGAPLRFSHALVQEVLEAGIGPVRRSALHAQVAEVLAGPGADPDRHAARIAHHFARAGTVGDPGQAARYAVLAADHAARRASLTEAERLLQLALRAAAELPPAEAAGWELQARIRLSTLLAQRLGYDSDEVSAQQGRAAALARRSGRAEELLPALWALWGAALVAGDQPRAEVLARDLADAAGRTTYPWTAVAARQAQGQTALVAGRLDEALEHLRAGVALVDALPEAPLDVFVQDPRAVLRGWLAAAATLAGAPSETEAAACLALARERDDSYTVAYLEILMGWRAVWLDRPEAALTASRRAAALARQGGFGQFETFALPPGAWALARLGDLDTARTQAERAVAAYVRPGHHMFGTLISSVAAEVHRLAGEPGAALAVLDDAIATAERTGERMVLPRLLASRRQAVAATLDA